MLKWIIVLFALAASAVIWHAATRNRLRNSYDAAADRAGLHRKIAAIDLEHVTIEQAVRRLRDLTGARITFECPPPCTIGNPPISFVAKDTTLEAALDMICLCTREANATLYRECSTDGTILLAPTRGPILLRTYDVNDIIASLEGSGPAATGLQTPEETLSSAVAAATGVEKCLCIGSRLVVTGTRQEQAIVERTLAQLRRPLQRGTSLSKLRPAHDANDTLAFVALNRPLAEITDEDDPNPGNRLVALDGAEVILLWDGGPIPESFADSRIWNFADVIDCLVRYSNAHRFPLPPPKGAAPLDYRSNACELVYQLVKQLVSINNWKDNGGDGSIFCFGDHAITVNAASVNQKIARLHLQILQMLEFSGPGIAPPQWVDLPETVAQKLQTPIPELRLENVAIKDAVRTVCSRAGFTVNFDESQEPEIYSAKVSLHLWNIRLYAALRAILGRTTLDYDINRGEIFVGTRQGVCTRIYDVRDLIEEWLQFHNRPGNPPRAREIPQFFASTGTEYEKTTADERASRLASILEESIASETWKDNGGSAGVTWTVGGLFVVTQTVENQLKVESVLKTLRSGGDKEGADLFKGSNGK